MLALARATPGHRAPVARTRAPQVGASRSASAGAPWMRRQRRSPRPCQPLRMAARSDDPTPRSASRARALARARRPGIPPRLARPRAPSRPPSCPRGVARDARHRPAPASHAVPRTSRMPPRASTRPASAARGAERCPPLAQVPRRAPTPMRARRRPVARSRRCSCGPACARSTTDCAAGTSGSRPPPPPSSTPRAPAVRGVSTTRGARAFPIGSRRRGSARPREWRPRAPRGSNRSRERRRASPPRPGARSRRARRDTRHTPRGACARPPCLRQHALDRGRPNRDAATRSRADLLAWTRARGADARRGVTFANHLEAVVQPRLHGSERNVERHRDVLETHVVGES